MATWIEKLIRSKAAREIAVAVLVAVAAVFVKPPDGANNTKQ